MTEPGAARFYLPGAAWIGGTLTVALAEFLLEVGPAHPGHAVSILFAAAATSSLLVLPGALLACLGKTTRARVRLGGLPLLGFLIFAGWSLTQGPSIRDWAFTPVLRVILLSGLLLGFLGLLPRLARRRRTLRVGLTGALGAACLFAHIQVFPGLYPAFHAALCAVAVNAGALAFAGLVAFHPRVSLAALLLGIATLLLVVLDVFPGQDLDARRVVLSDGRVAADFLVRIAPPLRNEAEAPEAQRTIDAITRRRPVPDAILDRRLPERREWSVLIVTVDALRNDHTGGGRSGRSATPRLDAFAESATVFTSARTVYPVTIPSTQALLTGRYPFLADVPDVTGSIAQQAREQGYRTGALLAFKRDIFRDTWPIRRGFDDFEIRAREAKEVTDRALSWWADASTRRRFLWLHYFDAHAPYPPLAPGQAADGGDQPARYRHQVQKTDAQIGRLFDALAANGDLERTLVIVNSDHGVEFGERGGFGQTPALFNESIDIPFLLRVPGAGAGRRLDHVFDLTCTAPTIAELLGWDGSPPRHGTPLTAWLWDDLASDHRAPGFALASWRNPLGWGRDWDALVEGDSKILLDRRSGVSRLFDLEDDPGETLDRAGREPARHRELRARLHTLSQWAASPPGSGASVGTAPHSVQNPVANLLAEVGDDTRVSRGSPLDPEIAAARTLAFGRAHARVQNAEEELALDRLAAFLVDQLPRLPDTFDSVRAHALSPGPLRDSRAVNFILRRGRPAPSADASAWLSEVETRLLPPLPGDLATGSFDAVLAGRLARGELAPDALALALDRLREGHDFLALATRYWVTVRPAARSEEARALLIDLADLEPTLGEPILRSLSLRGDRGVETAIRTTLAAWGQPERYETLRRRQSKISSWRGRTLTGTPFVEYLGEVRELIAEIEEQDGVFADWGLALEIIHLAADDAARRRELLTRFRPPAAFARDFEGRLAPSASRVDVEGLRARFESDHEPGTTVRLFLRLKAREGALLPFLTKPDIAIGVKIGDREYFLPLPPGGLPAERSLAFDGAFKDERPGAPRAPVDVGVWVVSQGRILGRGHTRIRPE